jgi:peptide chain release factor subunit 1
MGAVQTLIVWDNLEMQRFELKHPTSGDTKIEVKWPDDVESGEFLVDGEGTTWDIVSQDDFLEWLAMNYKEFGTGLEFVTDRSQEGAQFVKGFGGIGGFLRWAVNFAELDEQMTGHLDYDDDDAWI